MSLQNLGVCVFCLKSLQIENSYCVFKFIKFLKSYLKQSAIENLYSNISKEPLLMKCCFDCQSLLQTFCDMNSEKVYLELQLEWKLNQLTQIMKLASRVPKRVSNLNILLHNTFSDDKHKSGHCRKKLQTLRQRIISTSNARLLKSQPRVLLKRWGTLLNSRNQNTQLPASNDVSQNQHTSSSGPNIKVDAPDKIIHSNSANNLDQLGDDINNSTRENLTANDDTINQTEKNNDYDETFDNVSSNHESEEDADQYVVTHVKFESTSVPNEILDKESSSTEQTVLPVPSNSLLNENVEVLNVATLDDGNEESSVKTNNYYCSYCKKNFKSKAWLAVHMRKFHAKVENNLDCSYKNANVSSDKTISTPQTQRRYNLREKRTRKFSTLHEEHNESDNEKDLKCSAENTSESSTSSSESSEDDEYTTNTIILKQRLPKSPLQKLKSKSIIRKYRPRKKVPVKIEHEKVNGVKCFRCKLCKLTFSKAYTLTRHIYGYHKFKGVKITSKEQDDTKNSSSVSVPPTQPVQQKFKCNFCDVVMDYPADLANHETEHAPAIEINSEVGKKRKSNNFSKCPRCQFQYGNSNYHKPAYIRHFLKEHLKILDGNHSSACTMCSGGNVYVKNSIHHFHTFHNISKLEDPSKAFKCDLCKAVFIAARQLYRHQYLIHEQNNHKCEICEKVFQKRNHLRGHKNKLHKKWDEDPNLPIGCDVEGCKKRFKNQGEFEYHKHFHQNLTPWKYAKDKCPHCNKGFRGKTVLAAHINKAHCEQICQQCGKGFTNTEKLNVHLEYHKHPDEWKFKCTECGKKCVTRGKLSEHMRTHTKEKPFVCEFCGEKYAHRHNWRNHMKSKHGDEEGVEEEIRKTKRNTKDLRFMSRKGSKKGDCIIAGETTKPRK